MFEITKSPNSKINFANDIIIKNGLTTTVFEAVHESEKTFRIRCTTTDANGAVINQSFSQPYRYIFSLPHDKSYFRTKMLDTVRKYFHDWLTIELKDILYYGGR
jgi:hypothetical protein